MEVTRTVRPTIASRQLYITRSSAYGPSSSSSGGGSVQRSSRTSYGASPSGALALMNKPGSGGFTDVKTNRDKEKREMQVYSSGCLYKHEQWERWRAKRKLVPGSKHRGLVREAVASLSPAAEVRGYYTREKFLRLYMQTPA